MIEDVLLATENCRYCLMCRHVCPVGHVTRLETLTPHGWGLTIASIRRGIIELDKNTADILYSCADCGTCRANCVTDQPLPSAIAAMRADIAEQSFAPRIAYELREKLENWENPYGKRPHVDLDQGSTALFIGDDFHFLAPESLEAVQKLLRAANIEAVPIGIGRSNGHLASSLGFPDLSAALAQKTLDELTESGASRMLVLTPGDYYAFSQLHEDRHGLTWPQDVELIEVLPLLTQHLDAGNISFKKADLDDKFGYIDPSHALRVPSRFEAPRRILEAAMQSAPYELFWRRERTHPSGNGAIQYTRPEIASHLAYSRLDDARKSGATIFYSEDPGGCAHLNKYAYRFGVEIRNLYDFLAGQLID